jgi:hypothetical protein
MIDWAAASPVLPREGLTSERRALAAVIVGLLAGAGGPESVPDLEARVAAIARIVGGAAEPVER